MEFIFGIVGICFIAWLFRRSQYKQSKDWHDRVVKDFTTLLSYQMKTMHEQNRTIVAERTVVTALSSVVETMQETISELMYEDDGEEEEEDFESALEEETNEKELLERPTAVAGKLFNKLMTTRKMLIERLGEDHELVKQIEEVIDAR